MATRRGGYKYKFVDDNSLDKFTCSICTSVLRDPHLTGCCGQVFCESCLNYWFTKHGKESCPYCRAKGKDFQHFLDKRLKREIDALRIHCINKKKGCQWLGEVGSLKDHLESANGCGYVEVECPNGCYSLITKIKRKALEHHLKNDCYLRPYQCEHCGCKDTYKNITGEGDFHIHVKSHYSRCPEFPLKCSNRCGVKDIKRKNMEDHYSQCPKEPVQCPFKEAGCKKKLVRRELEHHMSATQQQHLLMVMGVYKEMKKENKKMKKENEEVKKELQQVKKELSITIAELKQMKDNYRSEDSLEETTEMESMEEDSDSSY